jgi:thiol:disulfide interchange protein DsbG
VRRLHAGSKFEDACNQSGRTAGQIERSPVECRPEQSLQYIDARQGPAPASTEEQTMRTHLKSGVAWAAMLLSLALPLAARGQTRTARAQMHALQQTNWIPEGSAHPRHVIYVFMDANCPYCHALWLALKPYDRSGLQMRAVLVGVISASSPGKAAAIFDAADPAAALRMNEARWGRGVDPGGGIAPVAHPSGKDLRELAHNEALMQAFGFEGTPGLVFADAQGKVYTVGGLPPKGDLGVIVGTASAARWDARSTDGH